ncbi:MAG: glycosyltransferase family 2 protein [Armatimonadota bacterium]
MLLSIIIVNWNTRDLLLECIQSVYDTASDIAREVIVVDNASMDGSVEAVRQRYSDVIVIPNDRNVGFGAANNIGLKHANGNYIALLNPDTVLHEDVLGELVQFMEEHKEIGIVGPMIVGTDGRMQVSSFGLFPSVCECAMHALRIWRIAPGSKLSKSFLRVPSLGCEWTYTEHLLGACMVMPSDLMHKLGGFDEDFFLFLEETDICYRTKQMGYNIAYCTFTSIVHLGEQSMQRILDKSGGLYIRSYNLFCSKHGHKLSARIAINMFLIVGMLVESIVGLAKYRSLRRFGTCLRALYYAYCKAPEVG